MLGVWQDRNKHTQGTDRVLINTGKAKSETTKHDLHADRWGSTKTVYDFHMFTFELSESTALYAGMLPRKCVYRRIIRFVNVLPLITVSTGNSSCQSS